MVKSGSLGAGALGLAILTAMWTSPAAAGDLLFARERTWFATVTGAQWAETRLPLLPYNIVTGNLHISDTYLVSASVNTVVVPDFAIPLPLTDLRFIGNSVEIEGKIVQHFGLDDNTEAALAIVLRSGEIPLWENASVNVAWANGLSYAFTAPEFEKGTGGVRGVDTIPLQYYLGLESEWTLDTRNHWHFVTMLHHRSGIYGLISPRKTGSNYIGAGLRFDFE